jgi:hypothetical protein
MTSKGEVAYRHPEGEFLVPSGYEANYIYNRWFFRQFGGLPHLFCGLAPHQFPLVLLYNSQAGVLPRIASPYGLLHDGTTNAPCG